MSWWAWIRDAGRAGAGWVLEAQQLLNSKSERRASGAFPSYHLFEKPQTAIEERTLRTAAKGMPSPKGRRSHSEESAAHLLPHSRRLSALSPQALPGGKPGGGDGTDKDSPSAASSGDHGRAVAALPHGLSPDQIIVLPSGGAHSSLVVGPSGDAAAASFAAYSVVLPPAQGSAGSGGDGGTGAPRVVLLPPHAAGPFAALTAAGLSVADPQHAHHAHHAGSTQTSTGSSGLTGMTSAFASNQYITATGPDGTLYYIPASTTAQLQQGGGSGAGPGSAYVVAGGSQLLHQGGGGGGPGSAYVVSSGALGAQLLSGDALRVRRPSGAGPPSGLAAGSPLGQVRRHSLLATSVTRLPPRQHGPWVSAHRGARDVRCANANTRLAAGADGGAASRRAAATHHHHRHHRLLHAALLRRLLRGGGGGSSRRRHEPR